MNLYRTHFSVIGSFDFPLDMLRYDSCFPVDTESADAIDNSTGTKQQVKKRLTVKLSKLHFGKDPHLTPDRWSSFLWVIDHRSIITEKMS